MSAYGEGRAGDTDFRRKWDTEEYAAKAKAREEKHRLSEENERRRKMGLPPLKSKEDDNKKKELQTHREKIDLEKNVGKVQVIQDAESKKQPGFYCEACDVTIKDSVTYLDHLNGRKHLANVGIADKVERADVSAVKNRLAMLIQKRKNPEAEEYDLDERLSALKQKAEEEKQKRKEKKRQKKEDKKKTNETGDDDNDEMAKMMGFSGFGSSKV